MKEPAKLEGADAISKTLQIIEELMIAAAEGDPDALQRLKDEFGFEESPEE